MNKLNFQAPITSNTGYGLTSTNILKALIKLNVDISLFPIGNVTLESVEDKNLIEPIFHKTQAAYDQNDPNLKIWHQFDLANRIGKGKYGALVFFEVDKLKPNEVNHLNNVDTVFVSSKWAVEILQKNGVTSKAIVAPLAVDTEVFRDYGNPYIFPEKTDTYKFINIGKWEIRKGHDFLLEAFNNAFTEEDNVELYMLNHNGFLSEQENNIWANMYRQSKLGNKITIMPRAATHIDLAKIIRDIDCGIFPARAEGWNNEILEVMALNKPIITTNYSAHTEYCTNDNAYLIDVDELTQAEDGKFFNGEGNWADLGSKQMDQTVEYMRKVYNESIKINPKGLETVSQYTWENTASIIKTEMLDATT